MGSTGAVVQPAKPRQGANVEGNTLVGRLSGNRRGRLMQLVVDADGMSTVEYSAVQLYTKPIAVVVVARTVDVVTDRGTVRRLVGTLGSDRPERLAQVDERPARL